MTLGNDLLIFFSFFFPLVDHGMLYIKNIPSDTSMDVNDYLVPFKEDSYEVQTDLKESSIYIVDVLDVDPPNLDKFAEEEVFKRRLIANFDAEDATIEVVELYESNAS